MSLSAFAARPVGPVSEPVASTLFVPVVRLRPRRAWLPRMIDPDRGCGWFESSQALRDGLEVTEWSGEPPALPAPAGPA